MKPANITAVFTHNIKRRPSVDAPEVASRFPAVAVMESACQSGEPPADEGDVRHRHPNRDKCG